MIQPDVETLEIGEPLIYVERKTGKRFHAEVLEANALTGRVRIRYTALGPIPKRHGFEPAEWTPGPRIETVTDRDTSVDCLFRVGGKRRVQ